MEPDSATDLAPEFFAKMVESVGVGIAIYGQDGRYIYVNGAYAGLFDVQPSELIGTAVPEIAPEIEADRFAGYIDSFSEGETREADTVHEYNGREVPVHTITTCWTIDGTAYHFGTVKDISERRAREREIKRKNERLEDFASIVSHDLRNPLTVANGYVDLLREDIDRGELRLLENALERMETLIAELLELARSKDAVGETVRVSLTETATEAWESVPTRDARLTTPESPVTLAANESRLQQLFENLFRNAIEHGGTDIDVTVGTTTDGFYVEDDGPGVPAEHRDSVVDPGYTTSDNGTGFGLSIVQRVAAAHGWGVRVTEGNTGGARFEITGVESIE